jgi:NADPH-dependent 2,4-dienoyl-CoA reductase/sulfur reductase-like enzyme
VLTENPSHDNLMSGNTCPTTVTTRLLFASHQATKGEEQQPASWHLEKIKMNPSQHLLIIGNGCAGTETAFAARLNGWSGPISLVGDEPLSPYHRPPLSKAYLMGETSVESLSLRADMTYEKERITLLSGRRAMHIDRKSRSVALSDGSLLTYDKLVLAMGGRPRPLPAAEEFHGPVGNFHYLRTHADADAIRGNFGAGRNLVIIGGGYIGLEVAAAAIKSSMNVVVLEAAPRVLARVTAPPVAAFYETIHREAGVDIRTGEQVERLECSADGRRVIAVLCTNGVRLPADLVVAGIGLQPNSQLASDAGLQVEDGIVVDAELRTNDEAIMAIGDCARYYSPLYERSVRIESVPNALEQARKAAAILCGKPPRADAAPWFWSDQYDLNLKMVGLSQNYDQLVMRGSPSQRSFSAFYLSGNRVLAVDTVNRPLEFNLSKQLITDRQPVDAKQLANDDIPLKQLISLMK